MEDKPSRGELLRKEQQEQSHRMAWIGTISTLLGIGLPLIAFLGYLKFPRYGLGTVGQALYSLAFILGGISLIVGDFVMLKDAPRGKKNKIVKKVMERNFKSPNARGVMFGVFIGLMSLLYGIITLINLFRGNP